MQIIFRPSLKNVMFANKFEDASNFFIFVSDDQFLYFLLEDDQFLYFLFYVFLRKLLRTVSGIRVTLLIRKTFVPYIKLANFEKSTY